MRTTKKRSGAEGRRLRKLREEAERAEEIRRRATAARGELPDLPHMPYYKDLGPAPMTPAGNVAWVSNVACATIREVLSDPVLRAPERWKIISDLVGKVAFAGRRAGGAVDTAPEPPPSGIP